MEFLMAVRTLIATTVMLFCSLWLARQLKIHRPRLPVSAVLILSLIMLFEPGMLAFLVWVVHDIASVNGGLMIHAYTFVKASVAIYLLFILPSIPRTFADLVASGSVKLPRPQKKSMTLDEGSRCSRRSTLVTITSFKR